MNCFQDMPLYGRKSEIAYLKGIIASILRECDYVLDQPLPRRNGCLGDCNCTLPTEATSHSEEDHPANCRHDELHVSDHGINNTDAREVGRCHFVLVSGPPGSGKRTLVTTALRECRNCQYKSPFLAISARFPADKQVDTKTHRHTPFTAMMEAFQELSLLISQQGSDLQLAVRQKLLGIMDTPEDANALCDLIPSVKQWFQESGDGNLAKITTSAVDVAPPILSGIHSIVHQIPVWFPVLQKYLHGVVSVIPLVFLLENLHHADETSLDLVMSLIQDSWAEESKGLLLFATYSDDDGEPSSNFIFSSVKNSKDGSSNPLEVTDLNDDWNWKPSASSPNIFRSDRQDMHRIVVCDLTWDDVREWVQDCGGVIQQCSAHQRVEITNIVFRQSNGNPQHIRYLLHLLEHDETLLQEPIHKKLYPSDIDELFKSVFRQQQESIQKVMQVVALLAKYSGYVCHDVLEIAVNAPCIDFIESAHCFGLVEYSSTRSNVYICHECFQKVLYDTILDVSLLCLEIGRRIWSSAIMSQGKDGVSDEGVQARVLLSTKLLCNSIDLLSDVDERIYMSQLCFEAGQKSSSLGNFYASVELFKFAINVLGAELWRNDLYEASLVLHNSAAQAYCTIADYENMKRVLDSIFDNAVTFRDMLPAYLILIYSSGSGHHLVETSRISSMVLRELGVSLRENPSTYTIVTHLVRVKWALYRKTDQFLINLPTADNAEYLVVTQLLSFISFIGYMAYPHRSTIIFCHLILSALKHGICGPSAWAFASYAFFLCSIGNFEEGHRMGQVALQFGKRFETWWPRLHVLVYGYVNHWTYPLRDSLEPLKRVQRASLLSGDLEVYAASSNFHLQTALNSGVSLSVLETTSHNVCIHLAAIEQRNQLMMTIQLWSIVSDLRGGKKKLELNGEINDSTSAFKHCIKEGNKFMVGNFYVYRTMWCYLIGDFERALQMAKHAFQRRQIRDYTQTFYEGLASLAVAWTSKSCSSRRSFVLGRKSANLIKSWADRCPENFRNKQWLLEAEIASLKGNSEHARSLFEQSIEKARHEGFIHEEAIAFERLGCQHRRLGNEFDAKICFTNARSAYVKWGASVLVDRLDEFFLLLPRNT